MGVGQIKGKDLVPIQSNELFEDIAIPDGACTFSTTFSLLYATSRRARAPLVEQSLFPRCLQTRSTRVRQVILSLSWSMSAADGAERNDPGETDNRDFSDTNTAQRLTADDVRQLKEGGASGQELLQVYQSCINICIHKCEYLYIDNLVLDKMGVEG